MAFSTQRDEDGLMNEINMIPLIDVMLVLLIVFIVTIPVIKHSVNIDLPRASSDPVDHKAESVSVGVQADGSYIWQADNSNRLNLTQLHSRLAEAAQQQPLPALHIQADKTTDYEHVARLMATAAKAGISSMGFITTPDTAEAVSQAVTGTGEKQKAGTETTTLTAAPEAVQGTEQQ